MITVIGIYLVVVNVVAFIMYGVDKQKAIKKSYRIPEKQLLGVACMGGSIGAYLGMRIFRHKTLHVQFYLGIPAIFIIQVIILFLIDTYIISFIG